MALGHYSAVSCLFSFLCLPPSAILMLPPILFSCSDLLTIYLFIYNSEGRVTQKWRDRTTLHMLTHSLNGHKDQFLVRLKPGARSLLCISPVCTVTQFICQPPLPTHPPPPQMHTQGAEAEQQRHLPVPTCGILA